ncbi:MAG: ABC transporter permease [Acidimicrobiales bacterium]
MSLTRRAAQYVLVVMVALSINFTLPRAMPGGPLRAIAGEEARLLSPEARQELLARYGLDRPLTTQLADYLRSVATGDLGRSLNDKRPVTTRILERLPWTLLLMGASLVVIVVVGVAFGVLSGAARTSRGGLGSLVAFLALDAMPPFWIGMLLILAFSVHLHLLPAFGAVVLDPDARGAAWLFEVARRLALPVTTLVLAGVGQTYLLVRYSMLSVMGSGYVLMARAKGLSGGRILFRHALPNAVLPVHTHVMLELGWLLGGAVVVETVFSYPGLGRMLFEAVLARDYPLLQGAFLLLTLTIIGMNLLADLTYPLLDPRVRRETATT